MGLDSHLVVQFKKKLFCCRPSFLTIRSFRCILRYTVPKFIKNHIGLQFYSYGILIARVTHTLNRFFTSSSRQVVSLRCFYHIGEFNLTTRWPLITNSMNHRHSWKNKNIYRYYYTVLFSKLSVILKISSSYYNLTFNFVLNNDSIGFLRDAYLEKFGFIFLPFFFFTHS